MENYRHNLIAGFVFLTLITLIAFFLAKDIIMPEKGQKMVVVFDQVSGLEEGHRVLLSGMEVGKVASMQLQDNGSVKAVLLLDKKIEFDKDYKVLVKEASALGGKYVDIQLGSKKKVSLSQVHSGAVQPNVFEDPNFRESFLSIQRIADIVEKHTGDEENMGTIGLLFNRNELFENIECVRENFENAGAQMEKTDNAIGKFLNDERFADDLKQSAENIETLGDQFSSVFDDIDAISTDIESGRGSLGKFSRDKNDPNNHLQSAANRFFDNIQEISDRVERKEGSIGKLVNDEHFRQELNALFDEAHKLGENIDAIDAGEGTLAVLFYGDQLSSDYQEIMASIDAVAARYRRGEGTIAKLQSDEILFKEMQRIQESLYALTEIDELGPLSQVGNIFRYAGGVSVGNSSSLLGN